MGYYVGGVIYMKFVQTVLGKIPADVLVNTDAHEHLLRIGGG